VNCVFGEQNGTFRVLESNSASQSGVFLLLNHLCPEANDCNKIKGKQHEREAGSVENEM
jgi:hypothetical protein